MKRRIAVIGVGHMGRRHAEKVRALAEAGAEVSLVGVFDLDPERAKQVADAVDTWAAPDAQALFAEADAAVVAVPTVRHGEVAGAALEAGLDVLVEKPIAATLAEAEGMLSAARSAGRVLQVGHLEWWNAATRVIRGRIRKPRFVEVRRLGPFPARATDVDVVRDLMIHDIDILQQVLGEDPHRIEALGVPVLTDQVDIASARLTFPSGCIADLIASRVSRVPVRKMRFFQRDGFFSIDFLAQSASIYRRVEDGGAWPRVDQELVQFEPEDALLHQMRAFVDAMDKRDAPTASAERAILALRTAVRVIEAMPSVEELARS